MRRIAGFDGVQAGFWRLFAVAATALLCLTMPQTAFAQSSMQTMLKQGDDAIKKALSGNKKVRRKRKSTAPRRQKKSRATKTRQNRADRRAKRAAKTAARNQKRAAQKQKNIKLQKALKAKGFFRGRTTGFIGRKTRRAVRKFQRSLGHKVTGRLSDAERTGLLGAMASIPEIEKAIQACRAAAWYRINGVGVDRLQGKKIGQGLELCRKAEQVTPENPKVWAYLSRLLFAAKKYKESLVYAKKSAAAHTPEGMTYLGIHYSFGMAIPKNYSLALRWFRLSSRENDPVSQKNLSSVYVNGFGVRRNKKKSCYYNFMSAKNGMSSSQFHLGECYRTGQGMRQNYKEALKWYKESAKQGNARSQLKIGFIYLDGLGVTRNYPTAIKWFEKAIHNGNNRAWSLLAYTLMGKRTPKYDKRSLEAYQKALYFAKELKRTPQVIAEMQRNICVLYSRMRQYYQAFDACQLSLSSFRKIYGQSSIHVASSHQAIGDIASKLHYYNEAISHYDIGLKILGSAGRANSSKIADILQNKAVIEHARGNYGKAISTAKYVIYFMEKHYPRRYVVKESAEFLIGLSLLKIEKYGDALKIFNDLRVVNNKRYGGINTKVRMFGVIFNGIGDALVGLNKFDEALKSYNQAARVNFSYSGENSVALTRTVMKMFYPYYKLEKYKKARNLANNMIKRLFNHKIMNDSRMFYGSAAASYQLYHKGEYDETIFRNYFLPSSFHTVQMTRPDAATKALSEMATRLVAQDNKTASLIRNYQDLKSKLMDKKRELSKLYSNPSVYEEDINKKSKIVQFLSKQATSLYKNILEDYPEYQRIAAPAPLSLKKTQNILGKHEGLVKLIFMKDEGFAWLVTKTGAKWVRLEVTEAALKKMVKTLRDGLDDPQKRQKGARAFGAKLGVTKKDYEGLRFDLATSHKLYKILFGQFEEELKGVEHLMIVPSGPLQSLPPAVLVTEKPAKQYETYDGLAKTPWLIKKLALTVLPSVSSLRALRVFAKNADKDRKPFLGFGDPLLEGHPGSNKGVKLSALYRGNGLANVKEVRGLNALPETATELNQIATSLHAEKGSVYLQDRATETMLKATPLDKVKVIAFSTHGLVSGDLVGLAEPALVMTPPDKATELDDGLLMASEVAQLKLNADWVLLSACNTASSDGTPGAEGLSGLARAFFYAGAKSLLVSHWPVYSDAAVALTTGAFKAQEEAPKIGRAEALRRSILKFMKSGGTNSHPERWAPFVIVGEGAQ